MPIHDWARVRANRFHHSHQDWTVEIARALNRGLLPAESFALAGQKTGGPEPDGVTLELSPGPGSADAGGGVTVQFTPPKARHVARPETAGVTPGRRTGSPSTTPTAWWSR